MACAKPHQHLIGLFLTRAIGESAPLVGCFRKAYVFQGRLRQVARLPIWRLGPLWRIRKIEGDCKLGYGARGLAVRRIVRERGQLRIPIARGLGALRLLTVLHWMERIGFLFSTQGPESDRGLRVVAVGILWVKSAKSTVFQYYV